MFFATETDHRVAQLVFPKLERAIDEAVRRAMVQGRGDYPMSIEQITKDYHLTKQQLHHATSTGAIAFSRRGKRVYIERAEVERFLKNKKPSRGATEKAL